jgi:hypothetical protein
MMKQSDTVSTCIIVDFYGVRFLSTLILRQALYWKIQKQPHIFVFTCYNQNIRDRKERISYESYTY